MTGDAATVDDALAGSGVCRRCGVGFRFRVEFYSRRGLAMPRTCWPCRHALRERLVERRGVVVRSGPRFCIVRSCGRDYVALDLVPAGWRVAFRVDPLERPAPGRLVVARDVRPLDDAA